jgi:hypothetical protein
MPTWRGRQTRHLPPGARNSRAATNYSFSIMYLRGSVLGPLLFIFNITPLSSINSKSVGYHHQYADGTQIYMSFSAIYFCQNISHLENTISSVQNWMSFNFFHSILLKLNF